MITLFNVTELIGGIASIAAGAVNIAASTVSAVYDQFLDGTNNGAGLL